MQVIHEVETLKIEQPKKEKKKRTTGHHKERKQDRKDAPLRTKRSRRR